MHQQYSPAECMNTLHSDCLRQIKNIFVSFDCMDHPVLYRDHLSIAVILLRFLYNEHNSLTTSLCTVKLDLFALTIPTACVSIDSAPCVPHGDCLHCFIFFVIQTFFGLWCTHRSEVKILLHSVDSVFLQFVTHFNRQKTTFFAWLHNVMAVKRMTSSMYRLVLYKHHFFYEM